MNKTRPQRLGAIRAGTVVSVAVLGLAVCDLQRQARVEGDGFLRQRGGSVVTCAGSPVYLFQLTEEERAGLTGSTLLLSSDIRRRFREKGEPFATTTCGVDGRFVFDNVPHGTYGVVTTVEWLAGDETQGGDVYEIFEVARESPIVRPHATYSVG